MLETQDLYLDKARIEDWRDIYDRICQHEESARYMFWQVPIPSGPPAAAAMRHPGRCR